MKRIIVLIILSVVCSFSAQEMKTESNDKAAEFARSARMAFKKGNLDVALSNYDSAIKADPENHIYHSEKGKVYLRLKDYNSGIREFETAFSKNADPMETYGAIGLAYELSGDSQKASVYLKKSLNLIEESISNPEMEHRSFELRMNKAFTLIMLGNEIEGQKILADLSKEQPKNRFLNMFQNKNKQQLIQIISNM